MLANVVVALIVIVALAHACKRYLPSAKSSQVAGCGSGCASCNNCETQGTTGTPPGARVIKIHAK